MVRRLFLTLPLLLILSGCSDPDLITVSKALTDTAQAVGVLQSTVIEANKQKLLTDEVTGNLLSSAVRVNEAGMQAVSITRGINKLAAADRKNVLAILDPVIATLADLQTADILGIHDIKTRQSIQAAMLLIQTALNTAKLALASR